MPATRRLLASAVRTATPTLGVCLGGQLLAAATGGTVRKGADGPEIGAYLTAKRDAAMDDPLFVDVPMTPDVMQYHYDVVDHPAAGRRAAAVLDGLPEPGVATGPGSVGTAVPSGNDRRERPGVGARRRQGTDRAVSARSLDDAEETMGEVWREFAHRFVGFARDHLSVDSPGSAAPRRLLPVVAIDE